MKCFLALCLIAAAAATAAPRIELDMSGMSSAFKLKKSIYRSHDLSYTQQSGAKVLSRQDWTEKCPAGTATNHVNCPFPKANAYDHQDKVITVKTRVVLVDLDGRVMNRRVTRVNFAKRSTYLFKYDAHDRAGNRAEQVVFALILDDRKAPKIAMCNGSAETVEAASKWRLCTTSKAFDNIDGSTPITYSIQFMSTKAYLCRGAKMSVAQSKITTKTVGRFLVTLTSCDKAGIYGKNSKNNCAVSRKAILVKDTRAPYIDMHGAQPTVHECATKYTDAGATATDLLDTVALGKKIRITVTSNVRSSKVGNYNIKYNCRDTAGNRAKQQIRQVRVRDTKKPSLKLKGKKAVVHYAGRKFSDAGVTCKDTCDKKLKPVGMKWSRRWNDKKLGDYIRTYTCKDASKNSVSVTRKFTIIDDSQPIITPMGGDETYEASRDVEYTDKGATCHDYVDGVLSHAVEVSGQVVNMRIPGKYVIRYDCQDLSGNQAEPMNRTVTIRDTRCPKVTLKGKSQLFVEAGFPYVDAGATATDSLDGDITKKIWTDGDTVDTGSAFYSRRSCREIKKTYKGAKTGFYYITVYLSQSKKFSRLPVWCDMTSTTGFTYYAVVCGKRVHPYAKAQGDCPKYGLKMAIFTSAFQKKRAVAKFHNTKLPAHSRYFPTTGTTDYYLCSTNDAYVSSKITNLNYNLVHHNKISRAEAGKYVIFYHVSDKAGNKECKTQKRTVTVRDTLPPVITLHLKKKLIHISASSQKGISGQANPAGKRGKNPFLAKSYKPSSVVPNRFMAEQSTSSVNGWVIGAVASAVTGVALLAMTRKTTTVEV